MAIYAIGDIQGCYDPLCRLLDKINFNPDKDQLWALGDLVNRGPASKLVLRLLKSFGTSARAVLGNHDLHLIAVAIGIRKLNDTDTIDQVLSAKDSDELIDWLRSQPLFYYDKQRNLSLVHAGIPPKWTLEYTIQQAKILESLLSSKNYKLELKQLYGELQTNKLNKELSNSERIKWIAAYLTRMRFCNINGDLSFDSIDPKDVTPECLPWFLFPESLQKGTIIFGHWAALNGVTNIKHIHALDTGCVWGGKLTAINIDSFIKTSVSAN